MFRDEFECFDEVTTLKLISTIENEKEIDAVVRVISIYTSPRNDIDTRTILIIIIPATK